MIYILDGLEKKGPYTQKELKELNLSVDTLVFSEEWGQWKKIEDLPMLKSYITSNNDTYKQTKNEEEKTKNSGTSKINLFLISSILMLLSIGISFIFTSIMRNRSYEEIKNITESFFQGKEAIGEFESIGENSGQFHKLIPLSTYLKKDNGIRLFSAPEIGFIKTKNIYSENYNSFIDTTFFKIIGDYEKNKKLTKIVDYFDIENEKEDRNLTILKKEINQRFSFKNITFLDMGYFVPEAEHYDYGYGVKGYISNHRPSVTKAYSDAAIFLLNEEGATHLKGSNDKLWSFDNIETEYYKISLDYPYKNEFPLGPLLELYSKRDEYKNLNLLSFSNENGDYTYDSFQSEEEKFKKPWFTSTRNMYMTDNSAITDSKCIVWFCESTNHYIIEEKKQKFYQKWAIYTSGLFIAFILLFLILKYLRGSNLSLK